MSFFDKLFSQKNRNCKNENVLKTDTDFLSFRSSHLSISKDQIRFILFRECDRRGRKLLFDSNSVEKIPLDEKDIMCNKKFEQLNSEKVMDFIETNSTHGYKYKKPSNDIACLGEMIFGSVAMIYKGENSCKIHSIPSPKQLMFTTIFHAPSRCPMNPTGDLSVGESSRSSFGSLVDINQQQTSSSDSKLYRKEEVPQKYSSTYPWIKHNSPLSKINQCCQISNLNPNLEKKLVLRKDSEINCLGCLCPTSKSNLNCVGKDMKKSCGKFFSDVDLPVCSESLPNLPENECDKVNNYSSSFVTSLGSENASVLSGSLSSLRRRWAQSYATSLESITFEDILNSPSKKRTKLGMAIVFNLNNTLEDELEKFLFNHTILIDSIINKLQSSVEVAYNRNENFVDLIYTAFKESQQSFYELITGGKYETPLWCTLIGDPESSLKAAITGKNVHEENIRINQKQDLLKSIQLKFLDDFCDILMKFDTKDTNFFISTLLTAVLTHHLSWVTSIAETDIFAPEENVSVIKNTGSYNPIWAQLNDLCGLLGSPLKCAKTIITGNEIQKSSMASIIQTLTYFIRCYNIIENIYEVNVEDIVNDVSETKSMKNFNIESLNCNIKSDDYNSSVTETKQLDIKKLNPQMNFLNKKYSNDDRQIKSEKNSFIDGSKNINAISGSLKRNKSFLSVKKIEETSEKLYPDIKNLAKSENVNVADLFSAKSERAVSYENLVDPDHFRKKVITIPVDTVNYHFEGYLSPDEGYNTIDSIKTENICAKKIEMEKQNSASTERKENIVFVLGDNEELVNLNKKIVFAKSSMVAMEKEDCNEFLSDFNHSTSVLCENFSDYCEKNKRTCGNQTETYVNYTEENIKHSSHEIEGKENSSWKIPWILRELKMPKAPKKCRARRLEVSSVLGGVNQHYNSEQVIQGVLEPFNTWEHKLQKDLYLSSHNPTLEENVNEALCIIGNMNSWEVFVLSSSSNSLSRNKQEGIRIGMSQLVADMLESFLYLHTINLPPTFCLLHIEKKLYEIYLKSQTVAELLNSTEMCNIDYLTSRLDIGINDVPLLLSVATTHSPHISQKYGLSFT